ncbi:UNVERIFIED_CONTAM: hypothetical protein NCL1_47960 [Trichonephila clavipes]
MFKKSSKERLNGEIKFRNNHRTTSASYKEENSNCLFPPPTNYFKAEIKLLYARLTWGVSW